MKKQLGNAVAWLGKLEMAVCMTITVLIVLTIAFQIVARYVFNAPVPWMEEVVTILFIQVTLLAAAVATKEKRHIIVDLWLQGPASKILGVIMSILTIVILVVLLYSIGPILKTELRRSTISLPFNFPIAYYNSIPLVYCFLSIIVSIAYDVVFERKAEQEALT